jgi:hypothetical protein
MKTILSFLAAVFVSMLIGIGAAPDFGALGAAVIGFTAFAASCAIGTVKGVTFTTPVPTTDIDSIAKWAGKKSKQMVASVLNGLDIFQDLFVYRNVSRQGVFLPKFTVEAGLRPLDTNVEENGTKERTLSGRILYVYDCMKLFKIIPEEVRESFLSDMLAPGAKDIPMAEWFWQREFEKLDSEINDNFYLSEFHANAADFDALDTYVVGDYIKFTDSNYYKCIVNTAAGESPTTASAKWTKVNSVVCFNGPAKIIADAITAGKVVPVVTGAITAANCLTKIKDMYRAMPVAVRKKGGKVHVSPDVYQLYLDHEAVVYPNALNQNMGDGKKYVYGSGKKWEIVEATWMGSSQRIIFNVQGLNLVVGTNLVTSPGITKVVETLHGYKAVCKFLLGSEISDPEVLFVNDQE